MQVFPDVVELFMQFILKNLSFRIPILIDFSNCSKNYPIVDDLYKSNISRRVSFYVKIGLYRLRKTTAKY